MDAKKKAVVLVSGGMDSCVAAAIAATKHELALLHASYGQRTEARERRAFEEIADFYGVSERLAVRLEHFAQIGGSALTDHRIPVPEKRTPVDSGQWIVDSGRVEEWKSGTVEELKSGIQNVEGQRSKVEGIHTENTEAQRRVEELKSGRVGETESGASTRSGATQGADVAQVPPASRQPGVAAPQVEIPITYVPFRNAHFLAVAVSWAEVIGAEAVFIGAVAEDSSGYPDCRPEYYRVFQELVREGTKPETRIEIVTPVIGMKKSEIVRRGIELGAPLHLTWSCYQFEDAACGTCESCRLRLRGFAEAGERDPIAYRARVAR